MACPICQTPFARDQVSVAYNTQHPLFKSCRLAFCGVCHGAYVLNPPTGEELKKIYDEGYYGWSGFLKKDFQPVLTMERCLAKSQWEFLFDVMKAKKISLCDIGAGYGSVLEVGKILGIDIEFRAFESSPPLRKRIINLGGEVFGDFFEHQDSKTFDLVWASHILEHYPVADPFLKKMKQVLKPGGVGFIEIPYLDFEFKREVAPHLVFYTLGGLQKVLERCGFRILKIDACGLLRDQAKSRYYFVDYASRKEKIKSILPAPLLKTSRFFYHALKALVFQSRPGRSVQEDLSDLAMLDRFEWYRYGGERSLIRAAFTPV